MKPLTVDTRKKSPRVIAKGGLTSQACKDEADINYLMRRYNLRNLPPPTSAPYYADMVVMPKDFGEAFERVAIVQEWFSQLPGEVRDRFGNDPARALEVVVKDLNVAAKIGLIPARMAPGAIAAETASAVKPEPSKALEGQGDGNSEAVRKGAEADAEA